MCEKCGQTPMPYIDPKYTQKRYEKDMLFSGIVNLSMNAIGAGISIWNANKSDDEDSEVSTEVDDKYKLPEESEEVTDKAEDLSKMSDEEIKNKITSLLSNSVTNLDDETMTELVSKYKQIKADNTTTSDDMVTLRLKNFVKGKQFQQRTANWSSFELEALALDSFQNTRPIQRASILSKTAEPGDDIDLSAEGNNISMDKLRELSSSYLEYADSNNDKSLDLLEFFRQDLISYYQTFENQEINVAVKSADAKIKELNLNDSNDVLAMAEKLNADSINGEELTLMGSIMNFTKLNQENNDNQLSLDLNELMAYHETMANFHSNDNKIDIGDFSLFNQAVAGEKIEITTPQGDMVEKLDYSLKKNYNKIKNNKK